MPHKENNSAIYRLINKGENITVPRQASTLIIVVFTLIVNAIFSFGQNIYGINAVITAVIFLAALFIVFTRNQRKIFINARDDILQRVEVVMAEGRLKTSGNEKLFGASIISDNKLSEFERTCNCEEIWLISDLTTELQGALYADIVTNNLQRGIKYKLFVPITKYSSMRIEQHKRKNIDQGTIEYYLIKEDFFFMISRLDFVIYDPYKRGSEGRRGYIGLDLPGSKELYAAEIGDDLIDVITSKLVDDMKNKRIQAFHGEGNSNV